MLGLEEDGELDEVGATFGFAKEEGLLNPQDADQGLAMEVVMSPPMIQVASKNKSIVIIKNSTGCQLISKVSGADSAFSLSLLVSCFTLAYLLLIRNYQDTKQYQLLNVRIQSELRGRAALASAPRRLPSQSRIRRTEVSILLLSRSL